MGAFFSIAAYNFRQPLKFLVHFCSMASSTYFVCQECGSKAGKWLGKCPSCGAWNSYVEEFRPGKTASNLASNTKKVPMAIAAVATEYAQRRTTGDAELDRVLGGGLVAGSLVLIGGEPGIGKSTLMLQMALRFPNGPVLYISGEESEQQIRLRADRIHTPLNLHCEVYTETRVNVLSDEIRQRKPAVVIIDSIQTLMHEQVESAPGSVSQIRECTNVLMRLAKEENIPVFLVGHITKDGALAGPKVLEHMVDTVLLFEGDQHHTYRILRTTKNRFGSTSELGIYEMQGNGLREVSNPSELLISRREHPVAGVAVGVTMEGQRPVLVETQALVSQAVYGTPQRNANGFDAKRLNMLLAVLEKKLGFRFSSHDVFVNVAGGFRLDDPAADLAIIAALVSSYHDMPVGQEIVLAGEVGLSGEVRPVARMEKRMTEAEKLGYKKIYIPEDSESWDGHIKVARVPNVASLIGYLFGGMES